MSDDRRLPADATEEERREAGDRLRERIYVTFTALAVLMAMNAHGVAIQDRLGKPIMSSFHGGWSVGGFAASALVAAAAASGLDPRVESLIVGVCLWLASLWITGRLGTGSAHSSGGGLALPTRPVILMMKYGWSRNWWRQHADATAPEPIDSVSPDDFGEWRMFVPQKAKAIRRAKRIVVVGGAVGFAAVVGLLWWLLS